MKTSLRSLLLSSVEASSANFRRSSSLIRLKFLRNFHLAATLAVRDLKDVPGPRPSLPFVGTNWLYWPLLGSFEKEKLHRAYEGALKYPNMFLFKIMNNIFNNHSVIIGKMNWTWPTCFSKKCCWCPKYVKKKEVMLLSEIKQCFFYIKSYVTELCFLSKMLTK